MAVMDWGFCLWSCPGLTLCPNINRLGSSLLLWEIFDELDIYIVDNHVNGLSNFSVSLTFTKVTNFTRYRSKKKKNPTGESCSYSWATIILSISLFQSKFPVLLTFYPSKKGHLSWRRLKLVATFSL